MAFVAAPYNMENDQDQQSYWPDHDEADITNEHFYDQFVSFDGGDIQTQFNEVSYNPPSPSLLLGNVEYNFQDLAYATDVAPDMTYGTQAVLTAPFELPSRPTPTLRRKQNFPSVLTNGSIDSHLGPPSQMSEPDLPRVEDISLQSPLTRLPVTEGPSLVDESSMSPKKSGLLNSVYSSIRKAAHRTKLSSKSSQSRIGIMNRDHFKSPAKAEEALPQQLDIKSFSEDQIHVAGPTDSSGLPLSPPLTGRIPPSAVQHGAEHFVTGHFEDPFSDIQPQFPNGISFPPAPGDIRSTTPIATPAMTTDNFYKYAAGMIDLEAPLHRPKQQRSTSIAEWPSEGVLTDDSQLWSDESAGTSSAYMTDNGVPFAGWWDNSNHSKLGQGLTVPNFHHQGLRRASTGVLSSINTSSTRSLGFDLDSVASSQPDEMTYEYNAPEVSGLMIQMPHTQPGSQPEYLAGAPIASDPLSAGFAGPTTMVPHLPPTPNQHFIPAHHGFTEHRRPRPRAPSSGARHHGSLTSPRKSSMHRTASIPVLREESPSPSPAQPASLRQRSASISSIRKKKSWSRQQQQWEQQQLQQHSPHTTPNIPRVPSIPAGLSTLHSSASFGSLNGMANGAAMGYMGSALPMPGLPASGMSSRSNSVSGSGGGGGISLGGVDFVNFTPSDKNVLMTGVAPSGSSKTKARREKEAADRRRRLNETALQAVQAAGGDVGKLRMLDHGYVIET